MRLFLTHIDTPYRILREGLPFCDDRLMVSSHDIEAFDEVRAVCALWCDKRLADKEGWHEVRRMRACIKGALDTLPHILSLEDGRVLGDMPLNRLKELYDDGCRILTPHWQGVNRLGGAHNTDIGLTLYGRHVLSAAMEMGFIVDLSHASDKSAHEILCLAKQYRTAVVATHSNFRAVTPHTRNLPDDICHGIVESGGFIGVSLVPSHVGHTRDISALLLHIDYAVTKGYREALCLGTDFDGTDELIVPLLRAADLHLLSDAMQRSGYDDFIVNSLFYSNAARFFNHHCPCLFR